VAPAAPPAPSRVRAGLDRGIGLVCRLVLAIFFRRIEVVGAERVPDRGDGRSRKPGSGPAGEAGPVRRVPLVVVANHVNGLIDPLFVLGPLGLPARMLGKSTLWKIPILSQLLDLAGVIPVYRRQDAGADTAKNRETFARSHEELARGGIVAIFPEGTSHDLPQLQPLKTGAARILLEAELRLGPLESRILPVGLLFEERGRFRSRALVVVGSPIDPAEELDVARYDEPTAVRLLTERVTEALERVTLNYPSWEEARLVERGARILEVDALELPRERRLAAEFEARRTLLDGLDLLRRTHPRELSEAVAAARAYDRLLTSTGLRDAQVIATYPIPQLAGFLARTALTFAVTLPAAVLGALLNVVPFTIVELVSRRFDDEPNQVATYKVFPGLVAYPLAWTIEGLIAGWVWGAAAGFAAALIAPLSGYVAVRFFERQETLWREGRAFLLLRRRDRIAEELRERRRETARRIEALVELWVDAQAFSPDSRRA
jgi:glycerol-3-phosphate O-acyltransferase/dihydroxyacetone phosphate acyltransferase